MIAYLAGLLSVAMLPGLGKVWLLLLAGASASLFKAARRQAFLFIAGVLLASIWGAWQLSHRLPDQHARSDVFLSGTLISIPATSSRRQSFVLKIDSIDSQEVALTQLRRLKLSYYDVAPVLQAGDRIEAVVRLFPPRGLSNPRAFDTEKRNLVQAVDARGYIRDLRGHADAPPGLLSFRQYLSHQMDEAFSPVTSATLHALVLGDRSGLRDDQWRLISETGTAHLMVVSGLHIAVIAGVGMLLSRLVGYLLLGAGVSSLQVRRAGLILAAAFAFGYALLSGMAIPVQRSLIMVLIFLAGEWTLTPVSGWVRWRFALILVTVVQPLAVTEPGAWLSFGAVALLLWILAQRRARNGFVFAWWRLQGTLFIGMLPVTAALFYQLGFLAPVANLLAVPLISLLVMALPLLLPLALTTGSETLTLLMSFLIDQFWWGLAAGRDLLGLYMALPAPASIAVVLATVAALWWLQPVPLRWRWPALMLLFPLLLSKPARPGPGEFDVTIYDVGQGLAVLVETSEARLLYDTGPGYLDGGSAFAYAIVPDLKSRALTDLELLVLSHGDNDHSGGAGALFEYLRVEETVSGEPVPGIAAQRPCGSAAINWRWGGVEIAAFQAQVTGAGSNDLSCVVRISNGHCSLLIPGDLGKQGERSLVSRTDLGPVTWLVAGHHGSDTSSSQLFLTRMAPEVVVFSRGAFNSFGHPAAEVVERVRISGAEILDTAVDGAVLLHGGEQCETSVWRSAKRRYWTAG
ncbi:DNA internalization-related competence protein ComEC/Rec2 [Marinobacterium lutimaris]|uniref:Competence protein ComEC n=1 Tax=Marinobacterium lutimaris TaxID=568106 RepID=A0A1H5WHV1_9GAMM|nr:DNA internalization-related competence protein ComEC/Rec2 [Marinobacterium lutimaris]SEF98923.1 competence protein ComEC [Marinobacterium lutimaris]